jgi:hypothetical protein
METIWIILILQAFICGILASNLADHKGHSGGAWFATGFFLGIFGLIAAAGLPSKQTQQSAGVLLKKCPDCAEAIRKEALVCKFCGMRFSKEQVLADAIESLQDKSTSNRLQALDAIRTSRDVSSVPHLVKLIENLAVSSEVSAQVQLLDRAVLVLTEIGGPAVSSELVSIMRKTGSMAKASKLAETLGSLRDPSSISGLIDSLQKSEVRDAASKALEKFGQAALPSLEQLAKDGKRGNRKVAEQIIAKIKQGSLK